MKSEEIERVRFGWRPGSKESMLCEIAYQLAIANESAQESRAKSVAEPKPECLHDLFINGYGQQVCRLCGLFVTGNSSSITTVGGPANDHSELYAKCREAIASLKNEGRYYVADRLEFELKKLGEL